MRAATGASLESLWPPYVDQGDVEAQFRLAYFYLFCGFDEEQPKRTHMEALLRSFFLKNVGE